MTKLNTNKLIEELTRDEGYRRKAYKDSEGIITAGIGRNMEDVGLSLDEAQYLLKNDIKSALAGAEKFTWFADLSPVRQRVIINMIFNLGITRFKQFKKTIYYIKRRAYEDAATEMLDSKWAKQVGVRAKRLSKAMKEGG